MVNGGRPARAVDLGEVGAEARARWRPQAAHRGLTLESHRERVAGTVWAARADLERAVDALLENALRYSPRGSRVEIVTGPRRIAVLDRGPGIAADERELVFERFRRGRTGQSGSRGNGLGLPIARELVREWGGEVTLEARAGGGTAAVISFDAAAGPLRPQRTRLCPRLTRRWLALAIG